MASIEAANKIRAAIQTLKTSDVRQRPLVEVLDLSHQLADAMKEFFGSLDKSILGEFRYIADFIQKTRNEIADLQPNEIRSKRIPGASMELDAVVKDTETATNTIMAEAEAILALPADDFVAYKARVDEGMMRMIEACAFQDLTGQRVNKVIGTLRHIESRVTQFADALGVKDTAAQETPEEARQRALLLNGPAIGGPATVQGDIDAMFGPSSQDDIDAMFN